MFYDITESLGSFYSAIFSVGLPSLRSPHGLRWLLVLSPSHPSSRVLYKKKEKGKGNTSHLSQLFFKRFLGNLFFSWKSFLLVFFITKEAGKLFSTRQIENWGSVKEEEENR